jgi:hypothetical protein
VLSWPYALPPSFAPYYISALGVDADVSPVSGDQQATMEKQFFVFEWPDAPSGRRYFFEGETCLSDTAPPRDLPR